MEFLNKSISIVGNDGLNNRGTASSLDLITFLFNSFPDTLRVMAFEGSYEEDAYRRIVSQFWSDLAAEPLGKLLRESRKFRMDLPDDVLQSVLMHIAEIGLAYSHWVIDMYASRPSDSRVRSILFNSKNVAKWAASGALEERMRGGYFEIPDYIFKRYYNELKALQVTNVSA